MGFLRLSNKAIEYLFYSLFLLVPLVFAGNTSELFEFNKMWLTFVIALLIAFFWISKMVIVKKFIFKRTIFDIPLGLFLASQVISTIISMDSYISFWGYYSRWNGGLLSIITYIFLFYAFVSNFSEDSANSTHWKDFIKKSLVVSVISGLIAVLWALPSHFGYDPTCLVFRGHFDTSCWTADFVPTIRIFGPLGQPDWLAGYLGVLLPISAAFAILEFKEKGYRHWKFIFYVVCFFLFYVSVLYTSSRSAIISVFTSLIFFFGIYLWKNKKNLSAYKNRVFGGLLAGILLVSFFAGIQFPVLNKVSFSEFKKVIQSANIKSKAPSTPATASQNAAATGVSSLDSGGTSSLEIRKIVWKGAINVWRANPIFGTGVETYAFAYYKFRPIEHNRVSEWNFLYNKAHNEYLNYLATTGAFGLLSYLFFIGVFLGIGAINTGKLNFKNKYLMRLKSETEVDLSDPLPLALIASFLSILIINFFGFAVVILNIYLLIIPAIFVLFFGFHRKSLQQKIKIYYVSYFQWGAILTTLAVVTFLIYTLGVYWVADTKYALGYNYNHAGDYQAAYPLLHEAVKMRNEPVFQDELSMNDAILAITFLQQASTSTDSAKLAQTLATEAIQTNNSLVQSYPNNLLFWKTRVRIFYSLASANPAYYQQALTSIQKVYELSPTDASVLYNLGVLYGQNGDSKKAAEILEKTVEYKPDYRDAHFALAIFYHDLSVEKSGKVKDPVIHQKAIDQLNYILKNLIPTDTNAKEYLKVWSNEK